MAVSKRLRYEVLRRDNHACRYCGAAAPDAKLHVDHVIPQALGGADTADNLVTACADCNGGKTSTTPDAPLVANVTDDALHWANAMKQAAADLAAQQKPKTEYRSAFKAEWDNWTYESSGKKHTFDLPTDWKTSIERFRVAGLPQEVWPDIVERAMTNKTVKADNLFRYCCGIAWRMVGELQDRAKAITGAAPAKSESLDSVVQAALDVWTEEMGSGADAERMQDILTSAIAAREQEDAHRIIEGAQYAAWFGIRRICDAIAALDHDSVVQKWQLAWSTKTGEYPDDKRTERVRRHSEALLAAGVYVGRVERAAIYAGIHRSGRLYFGLSDKELAVTGESALIARAAELWSASFHASAGRWPTDDESFAFFDSLQRIGNDGDIWIADIYPAAAAAGSYQDPDLSTCMTRHLSVFEAAARPLAPSA